MLKNILIAIALIVGSVSAPIIVDQDVDIAAAVEATQNVETTVGYPAPEDPGDSGYPAPEPTFEFTAAPVPRTTPTSAPTMTPVP